MWRLEFGSKNYSFFKVLGAQTHVTLLRATIPSPLPFQTLNPMPLPAPPLRVAERGEGEEEKGREGRLGLIMSTLAVPLHITGWDSFPLSVFSHLDGFFSLFVVAALCGVCNTQNFAYKTVHNSCIIFKVKMN